MNTLRNSIYASIAVGASLVAIAAIPSTASAQGYNPYAPITIYVTRHAEKMTELEKVGTDESGNTLFSEICGEKKCAEVLNAEGELRAKLLADWFAQRGVTGQLTHALSSHKNRTRQTITPTVLDAGLMLSDDMDSFPNDGIRQIAAVTASSAS